MYCHRHEPQEQQRKINFINQEINRVYDNINCENSFEIIQTAVVNIPRLSPSHTLIDFLFTLVKCLEDEQYNALEENIAEKLYDPPNKFVQVNAEYRFNLMTKYGLSEDEALRSRISGLYNKGLKYLKGF